MTTTWETEGDAPRDFIDAATGLSCAMLRGPGGHWCGYVGVPKGHPLYGKNYNETIKFPAEFMELSRVEGEDFSIMALFGASVSARPDEHVYPLDVAMRCHGGLTYSGADLGSLSGDLWWFGFDCAHAGDLTPKYSHHIGDVYRDEAYVRASLAKLCGDIASVAKFMATTPA